MSLLPPLSAAATFQSRQALPHGELSRGFIASSSTVGSSSLLRDCTITSSATFPVFESRTLTNPVRWASVRFIRREPISQAQRNAEMEEEAKKIDLAPHKLLEKGEAVLYADAIGIWRNADAVCFDVDSTVCLDEGIDALGEFCGAGEAVAAWTSRAMAGDVPFEEALAARLSLFTPSLADVQNFLANNPPKITPGIKELFNKLQKKGKAVYLISGGFRQMIAPVARILKVPDERIFANKLLFDGKGKYAGFDLAEPTARSGGKAAAIAQIKQKFCYTKLVMVGDGATDLEARQPGGADIFICFAGVQLRASVAAESDWCVLDFQDLIDALDEP